MFSKGISHASPARNEIHTRGIWHLTLCTLLSSQGSDAPAPHPHRAATGQLHNLTTRILPFLPLGGEEIIDPSELPSYASKPGPCYQGQLRNRILSLLRPFSTAAGRTFGVTRGNITWRLRDAQAGFPAGRVGTESHSTKTPARVFLPRRSTANPPGSTVPSRVAVSLSTRALFT